MDAEDDDFYSPNGAGDEHKDEAMDMGDDTKDDLDDGELEDGEEEEDSDADSIEIIVDDNALVPSQSRFPVPKPESQQSAPSEQATKREQATPSKQASAPAQPIQLKNGADYPEVHTSTVDINANPIYPAAGKPVTQIDIDADLAEHSKPWRLPGADQSDYFNYGFDEFTWASYVLRQQAMAATLQDQRDQTAQFQQMFGAIPGLPGAAASPSNNASNSAGSNNPPATSSTAGAGAGAGSAAGGIPTGPVAQQNPSAGNGAAAAVAAAAGVGGMPGMPMGSPEDMMTAMYQYMATQGISDPTQVDFGQFMQQFGGQMGMPGPGGGGAGAGVVPTGPAGYGGYGGGGQGGGGGGGGYGGRGRGRRGW